MSALVEITQRLCRDVSRLSFGVPVTHVYNPLRYAWEAHRLYLERFGGASGRVVLVGMNPGPFGMVQTGVPFGDVGFVRDWMHIEAAVSSPKKQHPKRPVEGFACPRREVSGSRLWGWAAERFGSAPAFFERFFVVNYCPLAFLEETGRNRTPDKLVAAERKRLFAVCDRALTEALDALRPSLVIGVGAFATQRIKAVRGPDEGRIGTVLHPSPASPKANAGWAEEVERQLEGLGVNLPAPRATMSPKAAARARG